MTYAWSMSMYVCAIVQDVKVDVREEVVLELVLLPGFGGLGHDLLHLANEAPDGQVIVEHLQIHRLLWL